MPFLVYRELASESLRSLLILTAATPRMPGKGNPEEYITTATTVMRWSNMVVHSISYGDEQEITILQIYVVEHML